MAKKKSTKTAGWAVWRVKSAIPMWGPIYKCEVEPEEGLTEQEARKLAQEFMTDRAAPSWVKLYIVNPDTGEEITIAERPEQ